MRALLATLLLTACAAPATEPPRATRVASLGVETVAPSEEMAKEHALPFNVRQRCRVVESVSGPAASAGIRKGDVLFSVDGVDLYSQDDLDDVQRVHRPDDSVVVAFKRGSDDVREVEVELAARPGRAPQGIAWRHASLVHLPDALAEARAAGRNVLVGLSGAET